MPADDAANAALVRRGRRARRHAADRRAPPARGADHDCAGSARRERAAGQDRDPSASGRLVCSRDARPSSWRGRRTRPRWHQADRGVLGDRRARAAHAQRGRRAQRPGDRATDRDPRWGPDHRAPHGGRHRRGDSPPRLSFEWRRDEPRRPDRGRRAGPRPRAGHRRGAARIDPSPARSTSRADGGPRRGSKGDEWDRRGPDARDRPRGDRGRRCRHHGRVIHVACRAAVDDQRLAPIGRHDHPGGLRDLLLRRGRPPCGAVPRGPSRAVPREPGRRQLRWLSRSRRDHRRGDPRRDAETARPGRRDPSRRRPRRHRVRRRDRRGRYRRRPRDYPSALRRDRMRRAAGLVARVLSRLFQLALVLVTLAIVVVIVFGGITTQRGWPQTAGRTMIDGLRAPVTVSRDRYGIIQVTADNQHDLFMAQGYAHAQERMWQMEISRRIGAGRLAELFGPSQVDTDRYIRPLGWRIAAQRDLDAMSDDSKAILEAYAEGVNAWIDQHNGRLSTPFVVAGLLSGSGGLGGITLEHWTPLDTATWQKVQAWSLGGNVDTEILRLCADAQLGSRTKSDELFPAYDTTAPVITPTGLAGSGGAGASAGTAAAPGSARSSMATVAALSDANASALADLAHMGSTVVSLAGFDRGAGLVGSHGVGSNNWVVSGD